MNTNAPRSVVALLAAAAAAAALAQGYGYGNRGYGSGYDAPANCYRVGGQLVCEREYYYPAGYMGDQKWCLWRERQLGDTALCSYQTRQACETAKGPRAAGPGRCILNPGQDDLAH